MARYVNPVYESFTANSDLTTSQYLAVQLDTSEEIELATANSKTTIGILTDKPDTGDTGKVAVGGTTKAIVSEAVVIGDRLTPTAAGKLEVVDAADEFYIATARQTATADGDIIEVYLGDKGEANTSDA